LYCVYEDINYLYEEFKVVIQKDTGF